MYNHPPPPPFPPCPRCGNINPIIEKCMYSLAYYACCDNCGWFGDTIDTSFFPSTALEMWAEKAIQKNEKMMNYEKRKLMNRENKMSKFKIGDKVKVLDKEGNIRHHIPEITQYLGKEGIVVELGYRSTPYYIRVFFDPYALNVSPDDLILLEHQSPKEHKLKIRGEYLEKIKTGEKNFEVRYNDRNFHVGDTIKFIDLDKTSREGETTYHPVCYHITYILDDFEGLKPNYVVMGITPIFS